jgi:hypothetical protein
MIEVRLKMSRIDRLQALDTFTVDAGEWDRWREREVEPFVTRCAESVAEEQVRGADEPDPPADH